MIYKREILNKLPKNKDEKLLLAISSGKDSTCLYYLIKEEYQNIVLAHVNHKQRAIADEEEAYLKQLAKSNNHKIYTTSFHYTNKKNFHSEAREFRYEFFKKIAKKENIKYILTAHHLNDQAETIIERLIKGSSLYGYSGINEETTIDDFTFLRPLIETRVTDIKDYIKMNNIKYYEDESNSTDSYLRNRIRRHIIPNLEAENESFLKKINEFHQILKEAHDLIREKTIKIYEEKNKLVTFQNLKQAEQKDLIIYMLEQANINKNYQQVELIRKFLNGHKKNTYFYLNDYLSIYKDEEFFYYKSEFKNLENKEEEIILSEENKEYRFKNYIISYRKNKNKNDENTSKLCYNRIKLPLIVRTRRHGDKIAYSYGTKELKKLLRERKIPLEKRYNIPIITDYNGLILKVEQLYEHEIVKDELDLVVGECYE